MNELSVKNADELSLNSRFKIAKSVIWVLFHVLFKVDKIYICKMINDWLHFHDVIVLTSIHSVL